MVGGYAAAEVCVELVAVYGGSVAVYNPAFRMGGFEFFDYVGVAKDYAGIIHKLAQPVYIFVFNILLNVCSVERRAARFERCCGHARGKLYFYVKRNALRRFCDIFAACHTANVGYFVRVGYYRSGTAGDYQRGELFRRELRALYMYVSVDISGKHGKPFAVYFFFSAIFAYADYFTACYTYISIFNGCGKNVDILRVF